MRPESMSGTHSKPKHLKGGEASSGLYTNLFGAISASSSTRLMG